MSRYTVKHWQHSEYHSSFQIEDNEAAHDAPERFLDQHFKTREEADKVARRLNRAEEASRD